MKELMLGILMDETFSRLPVTTKNKDFCFKEIKKIAKKHFQISKRDIVYFNLCYSLLNEAWKHSQKKFFENGLEFSNVLFIKYLIEDYPFLIKRYGLNIKHIKKLESKYDLSKHSFRTKCIFNAVMQNIDETIAQYNYRITK